MLKPDGVCDLRMAELIAEAEDLDDRGRGVKDKLYRMPNGEIMFIELFVQNGKEIYGGCWSEFMTFREAKDWLRRRFDDVVLYNGKYFADA